MNGKSCRYYASLPGSDIDVDQLTPLPEPNALFTVGFVGRLLYDKGVENVCPGAGNIS